MLSPRTDRISGYRVARRLATGGTSDVLLAECDGTAHGAPGELVVLKVLMATYRQDPAFERMFTREAEAYGRLKDSSIVELYDVFSSSQQMVMVLEYVDGLSLHRLRHALPAGFDDAACAEIARGLFRALSVAHNANDPETGRPAAVVHRDVNPSNILLSWDGDVKLADFGIAMVTGVAGDTKTGFIKGTFGYMSPEQVRGEPISEKTDIYAAMLILWELFSRRKAHDAGLNELELMRSMAHPRLPTLDSVRSDLPRPILSLIARGLQVDPNKRDVTADEAVAVLRETYPMELGRRALEEELSRAKGEFDRRASLRPPAVSDAPLPGYRDEMRSIAEVLANATDQLDGPSLAPPAMQPPVIPKAPLLPRSTELPRIDTPRPMTALRPTQPPAKGSLSPKPPRPVAPVLPAKGKEPRAATVAIAEAPPAPPASSRGFVDNDPTLPELTRPPGMPPRIVSSPRVPRVTVKPNGAPSMSIAPAVTSPPAPPSLRSPALTPSPSIVAKASPAPPRVEDARVSIEPPSLEPLSLEPVSLESAALLGAKATKAPPLPPTSSSRSLAEKAKGAADPDPTDPIEMADRIDSHDSVSKLGEDPSLAKTVESEAMPFPDDLDVTQKEPPIEARKLGETFSLPPPDVDAKPLRLDSLAFNHESLVPLHTEDDPEPEARPSLAHLPTLPPSMRKRKKRSPVPVVLALLAGAGGVLLFALPRLLSKSSDEGEAGRTSSIGASASSTASTPSISLGDPTATAPNAVLTTNASASASATAVPSTGLAPTTLATSSASAKSAPLEKPAPVEKPSPEPTTVASGTLPGNGITGSASLGTLVFPIRAKGHRVYLDDRLVGESPKGVDVSCGKPHVVRIGSHGKDEPVTVGCGETLEMK